MNQAPEKSNVCNTKKSSSVNYESRLVKCLSCQNLDWEEKLEDAKCSNCFEENE